MLGVFTPIKKYKQNVIWHPGWNHGFETLFFNKKNQGPLGEKVLFLGWNRQIEPESSCHDEINEKLKETKQNNKWWIMLKWYSSHLKNSTGKSCDNWWNKVNNITLGPKLYNEYLGPILIKINIEINQ